MQGEGSGISRQRRILCAACGYPKTLPAPPEDADRTCRFWMAGDGTDNASALATTDMGNATGTGADIALSSPQVTLLEGDLRNLARDGHVTIHHRPHAAEPRFAVAYYALAIPQAAGVCYLQYGGFMNPMLAALAMSLCPSPLSAMPFD